MRKAEGLAVSYSQSFTAQMKSCADRNRVFRSLLCAGDLALAQAARVLNTQKRKGGVNSKDEGRRDRPCYLNQSKRQKPAGATSNLGNHPRLSLGAVRRRRPGGQAQDIEQGFTAHVAQHDPKRESGDRRTKYHQHTYINSHNGPST
jgi:hypothetical protein